MKLAVAEGFVLRRLEMAASLRQVRAAGFAAIELIVPQRIDPDAPAAQIVALRKLLAEQEMRVVAVGGGWPIAATDESRRSAGARQLRAVIRLAAELGAPFVTSEMNGGSAAAPKDSVAAFERSVSEIVDECDRQQVTVAFEPHPGDFVEDHVTGVDIVRKIEHSRVRYLFCTPHTFILGSDPAAMIRQAADVLAYVHVADSNHSDRIVVSDNHQGYANALEVDANRGVLKAHEHLPLGRGDIDFAAVAKALADINYAGVLSAVAFDITSVPELVDLHATMAKLDFTNDATST